MMPVVAVIVAVSDPGDERLADYIGRSDREAHRPPGRSGDAGGSFLVAEGRLVITQLLRSRYRVRSLLVTDRGLRALEAQIAALDAPIYLAPETVVARVCGFPFHRGALASADRGEPFDPEVLAAGAERLVVVEGVNDHENLGALFRNAAAFGVGAVLLDPTTADPLYRRSIRVSMGHALRIPFARLPEWPQAIGALRERGFEVLALTPSAEAGNLTDEAWRPRQALLVGAEGSGLSAGALAAADRQVRIALSPGVDSLNVATSAAIALHHLTPPWS